MSQPIGNTQLTREQAKKIVGFKSGSYKDYLAARVLYNSNFLHQASMLANTSIEKGLKAYLMARGIKTKPVHDNVILFGEVAAVSQKLSTDINTDFLTVLSKIYRSRYYDVLDVDYNFVILRNKFLAELDHTVALLDAACWVVDPQAREQRTQYEIDRAAENPFLFENNYVVQKATKSDFVQKPELVHEFRVLSSHDIFEVSYITNDSHDDSTFMYEALVPKGDGRSYTFSHQPAANT